MRIALLSSDDREIRKLYKLDHPIVPTPQEALLQGFACSPDVEVHMISCLQRPTRSPGKLEDNVWYHALLTPKIGWLRTGYQGCIRAVRKKLREIRPDIVHGQGTERDCAISAVFSGFPNVLTIHGNMRLIAQVNRARPFSYLWLAARLEALTLPRTHGVVCITNYTRSAVAGLAKRTWVVPNATDERFFEIRSEPAGDAGLHILFVGNIDFRKNQNAFIHAIDPLAAKHRFTVTFLGRAVKGRSYDDEFIRLVTSRRWCSYEGFADRDKLKVYFQRASALVLPSHEDNCPMVVLEAMAAGVPVLAAKVGGVPDLIEEGKTGLFCDPKDEASMRMGLQKLLEDPGLRSRLAATAKEQAKVRFHPTVIARRHLEIYREVLQTAA